MEKRFITKIYVARRIEDSRCWKETLLDLKIIPSADGDDLNCQEVADYWSDYVLRCVDFPSGCRYRLETSYTRVKSKVCSYFYKSKL